ncbi:WD40 repeat domain-containing protein [Actinoplanes sp. GCM10030250]|uniref:WD40 repeat domain-containing protein n=1 Tax=Actinoplanes sp. GCM10030250 TaxID=3273376 RepID=UPI003617AB48
MIWEADPSIFMDEGKRMSQGWELDDRVVPHRVLRTSLGFNELHSFDEVGPAALVTVAGRPTLVCAGLPTPDGSHYAAIDVETGARVPDRSGLHGAQGPQGVAVGMCGDRAVAALMTPHPEDGEEGGGALRLRDLWSGELVDVQFPAMRVRSKIAVAGVDGRGIVAVGSAVYDALDGSFITEHLAPGFVLHAVHRGRLLLLCYDFRQRFFWFIDALTGATVGETFEVPLPNSRDRAKAAVEVDGHLWVFFVTGRYGADPLLAWNVTAGHAVTLPALWDAEAAAEWPIEDVDVMCQNGEISVLVQWGYHGRHGTELWVSAAHGRRLAAQFGESTALAIGVLDGRPAAVAADEGRALRVFDLAADAMVASPYYNGRVVAPELRIRAAAFADIGGRGSVLRCGATGVMWDVESGLPVGAPFSGDGVRNIAAGLFDGQAVFAFLIRQAPRSPMALRVWDPQAAETLFYRELPSDPDVPLSECPMTFVEVDGLPAVAMRCNRHIELFHARTGETVGHIEVADMGIVSALAAGRLGGRTVLAAGDGYGAVYVFDPATGQEVTPRLGAHHLSARSSRHANAWVRAIAFAHISGREVVITSADHIIRVWDATTGEAVGAPLSGHTGDITALLPTCWAGEAALISVASRGAPRLWMLEASPVDTGHTGTVTALAAGTRNGQPVFASSSEDATIRLWDVAGRIVASIDTGGAVTAVAFGGPGRDILVGVTDDGVVQRWDANSGAKLGGPLHHGGPPLYAAATVDMDGRYLLGVSGADETLRVWDLMTAEPLTRVTVGHTVRSLSMAATGGRLLAMVQGDVVGEAECLAESMAVLWDVWAGEPVRKPLQLGDGGEVAVLGVLNGRAVLVQGLDVGADDFDFDPAGMDDLQLRDAVSGDLLNEFDDHRYGRCGTIAMVTAAGRNWIVSGHEGGVVLLDDELRQIGKVYDGHKSSAVKCVAVAETTDSLAIASSDYANSVHIWTATIPG